MDLIYIVAIAVAGLGALVFFAMMTYRRIVPTNEVHIVQRASETVSYGKDTDHGNIYYEWPSALPLLGVTKIILPTSVFSLNLDNYEAYDSGRLPFSVDVSAFFRVDNSNLAAQRISSFAELQEQLESVIQGAVRSVLASNDIDTIMKGRSTFGDQFTEEVREQLKDWGISVVKNLELMDIRDGKDSKVIHSIMEKKKSFIQMESREEVAKNMKTAEVAELEARREVDLQKQKVAQEVGLRRVESERQVQLAEEEKNQLIKVQKKTTMEKDMEVRAVESIKTAEIGKQASIINAEQAKQMEILKAEARLETEKRQAEAVLLQGKAKADSETALLMAPVESQIRLAKEIGENQSYQHYLLSIKKIEADKEIGIEQAKALNSAEIKVIANAGTPQAGVKSVMELFTSQGGTQLGAMIEGLANTDAGKDIVNKFLK